MSIERIHIGGGPIAEGADVEDLCVHFINVRHAPVPASENDITLTTFVR